LCEESGAKNVPQLGIVNYLVKMKFLEADNSPGNYWLGIKHSAQKTDSLDGHRMGVHIVSE
jgi:hypothetical protein